jgi:16S rRNA G966 N2-methylase RsmD/Zn ribbon nucleic-acid-binding protein
MKIVQEPIDRAMVAKTHPSMYLMHKYWARKPHNIIAEYINYFTDEGDLILDPFCGSGVTVAEALKLKRKAIGVDLNPMACFITEMTVKPIDLKNFRREFERLDREVKPHIYDLYATKCPKCHNEAITTHTIWEQNKPILVRIECSNCGRKTERRATEADRRWIEKINRMKIPYYYPKDIPLHFSAKRQVDYIHELFEHRALIGLSILLHEIEKIAEKDIRLLMKFVFTSAVSQASRLVFVIKERGGKGKTGKYEVGSWTIQNIWVPPERFEINVWNCFKERFSKIDRGKRDSAKGIGANEVKGCQVYQRDARNLSFIGDEQVDYIFTDPPYGDAIPYFGMSLVWASWLRMEMPFEKEILIREKSDKEKEFEAYKEALKESFIEMYRVLKPGGWLSVTFHNRNIKSVERTCFSSF